jgi:hypothetical protein
MSGARPLSLALALLAVSAAGCTALGGGARERRATPTVVGPEEISRYPAGSPQRDFLRWWRQLQYNNPEGAASYYAADLALSPENLERELRFAPTYFNFGTNPEIGDVTKDGDRAKLSADLVTSASLPDGSATRKRETRSFELVREHGVWKQAGDRYLGYLASLASRAPPKPGAGPVADTGTR